LKLVYVKIALLIVGIVALFSILIIIVAANFGCNSRSNEIYTLLNNPTFIGEVVDKEFVWSGGFSTVTRHTEHRVHIIGEYIYDNEVIQVDRIFIISRYLYNQFDIGDLVGKGLITRDGNEH